MNFITDHLLTITILLPLLGAAALLPIRGRDALRWTALGASLATLAAALSILLVFSRSAGVGMPDAYGYGGVVQLVDRAAWIPAFNIEYLVGVDGLSLPMVILTSFIFPLSLIASWKVEQHLKAYLLLMLLQQFAVLGMFVSLDLFLFFVFFEASLLPMYFLIGLWGGERRLYAAIKFFIYTLVGSLALLVAVIGAHLLSRAHAAGGSFDLIQLPSLLSVANLADAGQLGWARVLFALAMAGFLVKLPSVPLHTWLPDAHVEAPTPVSMVLAAVLLKMGGYGILRVAYPLFPEAARYFWPAMVVLALVSIIYGALVAMAQTDFKRLVAYSSVSHMGFVLLGAAVMTPIATAGALFMMVAHGVTSAMMFFVVGVLYDRTHHRDLNRFGGIATSMPAFTGLSAIACFASLGLPGLCNFIGEVMVLLGTFSAARHDSLLVASGSASPGQIYAAGAVATGGIVLAAAYTLWAVQRVYFGNTTPETASLPDVDQREMTVLIPLAVSAVLLGILPAVFVFV